MIMISGTLHTSTPSAQGVLRCELGAFSVSDERLASLTPGDYEGLFEIDAIQPKLLPSSDSTVQLGVVATLKRFSLNVIGVQRKSAAKKQPPSSEAQPQLSLFGEEELCSDCPTESADVFGEELSAPTEDLNLVEAVNPISADEKPVSETASDLLSPGDIALFGERFELSATVQLDVTESREKLCQQRDRLKQLGYRFNAQQQVWERGE